jgi:hypothetical protein
MLAECNNDPHETTSRLIDSALQSPNLTSTARYWQRDLVSDSFVANRRSLLASLGQEGKTKEGGSVSFSWLCTGPQTGLLVLHAFFLPLQKEEERKKDGKILEVRRSSGQGSTSGPPGSRGGGGGGKGDRPPRTAGDKKGGVGGVSDAVWHQRKGTGATASLISWVKAVNQAE